MLYKGKHTLWKVSVLYKLHMLDDNLIRKAFCLSDVGRAQGTNDTPLLPFDIRIERCPGYEVGFMTKCKLNYWKLSIIKNHTLTWKPK